MFTLSLAQPLVALSVDLWQTVFAIAALAILAYHFWEGWSSGLTRKLATLSAMVIAFGVGWLGASFWGGLVATDSPFPRPLLNVVAGAAAGIVTFIVLLLLALLLTQPTKKKDGAATKLLWGIGGGAVGLCVGAIWIILAASLIRFSGTLAEAGATLHNLTQPAEETADPEGGDTDLPTYLAQALRAAEAVENVPFADLLDAFDPIPEKAHRLVEKIARITTDREALYWLSEDDAAQRLLENEVLVQALNDPQIRELARQKRFSELLTHPRIKQLTEDETILEQLNTFDFEAALDRAWERRDELPTVPEPE
ncbi:MAG: hypothetical protein ACFB20_03825 [Opitutales bacterium]